MIMFRKRASSGPPPASSSEEGNILEYRTETDGGNDVFDEAVASSFRCYDGAFNLIQVGCFGLYP
jgi:hypothetical protein